MDWSVTGVQSDNYTDETRLEWAGGTELLGGEANVFLDWSNKYGMTRRQQQYYWKWVDNHQTWLRQAQVGRIESRSITSLLAPIDGVSLSNASTTVRKALGEYVIADRTEPNWVVELYINGTLIAFTTADASGFYRFTVPLVYGTPALTLRFYGPKGEMRSAQKRFQTPYNMLPVGEFEYNITGGVVMDTLHSVFSRAEVSYGISRWLSMGAGVEYVSSLSYNRDIPFASMTMQPTSWLFMTADYAYRVRSKATMNISLPFHIVLSGYYTWYDPDQEAIIYHYLEERQAGISIPFKIGKQSFYIQSTFKQNVFNAFSYNTADVVFSGGIGTVDMNVSHYMNWTGNGNRNLYANAGLGVRLFKNWSLRPSMQYNYSTRKFISARSELTIPLSIYGEAAIR